MWFWQFYNVFGNFRFGQSLWHFFFRNKVSLYNIGKGLKSLLSLKKFNISYSTLGTVIWRFSTCVMLRWLPVVTNTVISFESTHLYTYHYFMYIAIAAFSNLPNEIIWKSVKFSGKYRVKSHLCAVAYYSDLRMNVTVNTIGPLATLPQCTVPQWGTRQAYCYENKDLLRTSLIFFIAYHYNFLEFCHSSLSLLLLQYLFLSCHDIVPDVFGQYPFTI